MRDGLTPDASVNRPGIDPGYIAFRLELQTRHIRLEWRIHVLNVKNRFGPGYGVSGESVQSWVWRQLHVALPDDWELLQFSRNAQAGRCAFADRYQFRFELNWRIVEGTPDFDRMLSDYRGRLEEDGLQRITARECADWRGVHGEMPDGRVTSRYGNYFRSLRCLVEIVFLWPKRRNPEIEEEVLRSVMAEPANESGQARWIALGMEIHTGAGFEFERCDAEPAHGHFCFTAERRRLWDHFSRRGLVSHWMTQPLEEWQRGQVPKEYGIVDQRQRNRGDHRISRIVARRKTPVLIDWIFGRREYHVATWLCPEDGRLYSLSRQAPKGRFFTRAKRPPAALRCCRKVEVAL